MRTRESRRYTSFFLALASAIALTMVSGCGLLGNSDSSAGGSGAVEKSKIKVALLETVSLAPFHLADRSGYFKQEGLEVEFTNNPSGQATLQKVISGEADIAYSSYVAFFVAQAKGVADLKFVADANSASPRTNMVVTKPGSSVQSVRDLAGNASASRPRTRPPTP